MYHDDLATDNVTTCQSSKHSNTTNFIANTYEGIPETFVLNLIAWCFLLILFAFLRNRAWDYGRLALVYNEKWTHLFYKNIDEAVAIQEEVEEEVVSNNHHHDSSSSALHSNNSANNGTTQNADINNCCSWFWTIFKLDRQRVRNRCGPDAFHYLSFQRHLLMLSSIITLIALGIILPVNFQGTLRGNAYTFAHTTVSNLDPQSKWLWIHVVTAFAFVPLTVLIMRRCSSRIPLATPLSLRTIMVTHISKNHRNADEIRNYFSERYRHVDIVDVQVPYKIKQLTAIERERDRVRQARLVALMSKSEIRVQPGGCIVCCPWRTQSALQYYSGEEERLNVLVEEKLRVALQHPVGVAFVTVATEEGANYIVNSFVPGTRFHWTIMKSPAPSDIIWENLQVSFRNWYSKAVLINCFLFVILFFLTTPAVVVTIVNSKVISSDDVIDKVSHPFLAEFLPTLILLTVSGLMPVIVAYSDQWMSHWTKSEQNFATMQKTFYFLLFMVLILPSLGLTSAQALLEWSVQAGNRTYQWECVFLPDKGAFFVNYVITSALIGTALELLRFPELAMYVWRLLLAKSPAEKVSIQKEIQSEFPFGIHYAWTLLIFTTSTVYSTICPLITPFGLLYLCLKHLVDKHNLFCVYRPSSMCGGGQNIHTTAVRNVRLAIILLQVIMLAFAIVRGGFSIMSVVTIFGLITTCSFFCIMGPFPSCKPTSSPTNNVTSESQEKYLAPVLTRLLYEDDHNISGSLTYISNNCSQSPRYGSSSIHQVDLPVST